MIRLMFTVVVWVLTWSVIRGQDQPIQHDRGQGVTPAFEGSYKNPDGTFSLSFGYLNRNFKEDLDIPIGPGNRLDPGGADQGQPTHFLTRRQNGVFVVVVPRDFGTRKVTWTLSSAGETVSIPGSLNPLWEINALKETTAGNTPPILKFDPSGAGGQGPFGITTTLMPQQLGALATLRVWATDDGVVSLQQSGRAPRLTLTWSKYRGPGAVTFADQKPSISHDDLAVTTASFSAPGEYVLRVLANDYSGPGGGGSQCCWTNGYARVAVRLRIL